MSGTTYHPAYVRGAPAGRFAAWLRRIARRAGARVAAFGEMIRAYGVIEGAIAFGVLASMACYAGEEFGVLP